LEDAIANYDACKAAIEDAAGTDEPMSDADVSALKYVMDVYRYCVSLASIKQVRN
jgi:hypothetical protein